VKKFLFLAAGSLLISSEEKGAIVPEGEGKGREGSDHIKGKGFTGSKKGVRDGR